MKERKCGCVVWRESSHRLFLYLVIIECANFPCSRASLEIFFPLNLIFVMPVNLRI